MRQLRSCALLFGCITLWVCDNFNSPFSSSELMLIDAIQKETHFFLLNSEHCSMEVCRIVSHFLIMLIVIYLFFLLF